jgi:hypothetical protein
VGVDQATDPASQGRRQQADGRGREAVNARVYPEHGVLVGVATEGPAAAHCSLLSGSNPVPERMRSLLFSCDNCSNRFIHWVEPGVVLGRRENLFMVGCNRRFAKECKNLAIPHKPPGQTHTVQS